MQEHAAHARFAVADGAQSAAQVQLLADERDGVFGGGGRNFIEAVVGFDAVFGPAERFGETGRHLALRAHLPVFAQAEDDQAVACDEVLLGFVDGIVGRQSCGTAAGRRGAILPAKEGRLIGEDQSDAGFRGPPQNVEGRHGGGRDAFHGSLGVAGFKAIRTGGGPVSAESTLNAGGDVPCGKRGGARERDLRGGRGTRQQGEIAPRYLRLVHRS